MARAPELNDEADATPSLPEGARIGAVVSSFHSRLTRAMCESAKAELIAAGMAEQDFLVLEAPGAFELPIVARRLAIREDVAAVLCFGLVLKGETTHDRYVADAAARGVLDVSLQTDKPVLFGVLTCDTLEQAEARALPAPSAEADADPTAHHDKGREVARAAVATIAAMRAAENLGRTPLGFGFGTGDAS